MSFSSKVRVGVGSLSVVASALLLVGSVKATTRVVAPGEASQIFGSTAIPPCGGATEMTGAFACSGTCNNNHPASSGGDNTLKTLPNTSCGSCAGNNTFTSSGSCTNTI